jgi:hypothetical protein
MTAAADTYFVFPARFARHYAELTIKPSDDARGVAFAEPILEDEHERERRGVIVQPLSALEIAFVRGVVAAFNHAEESEFRSDMPEGWVAADESSEANGTRE